MNISKKNAEHYSWGQNCDGWHLLKTASLSVIEERMPASSSEQLHCHQFSQQLFYILSGTASFEINGEIKSIGPNESIYVPPRTLHRIANRQQDDLLFLLVSEPPSQGDRIEIIEYTDELKEHIYRLNVEWLQRYFKVEPNDAVQLSNPRKEIIDKGGLIFYAKYRNEIVATVSLMKVREGEYELAKMAVTASAQGTGIGNILMDHSMNLAKLLNIKKLILYSNTQLGPAIHLYKKYGFHEVSMETGLYERANIKMEKAFD